MSVLTDSNNINFDVCHRVLSQSVHALLSLPLSCRKLTIMQTTFQPFSTRKTLINALSSEVCTGMFTQMITLRRSPFPVTLQRIFNTRLKKLSLVVFCCNFWTLQQQERLANAKVNARQHCVSLSMPWGWRFGKYSERKIRKSAS